MPFPNSKLKIKNLKFARGFTLIELLVVISIMAVLAGGLLYSTNNVRDKGKDARRKADLQSVASALTAYFTDNHHYPPTSLTDHPSLDYVSYPYSNSWIPDLAGYLDKLPKDPLQAGLPQSIVTAFESGKKIASNSWSWLTSNQTRAQKPKGQVAGVVTGTYHITASTDDGKQRYSSNPALNNTYENGIKDNPTGRYYGCSENETRSNNMIFSNVSIPKGARITIAKITFTPRSDDGGSRAMNSAAIPDFTSTLRGELALNPGPILGTNGNDFTTRSTTGATTTSVPWNNIPIWEPSPAPGATDTPNISNIIEEIVGQDSWASGGRINIFWLDTTPNGKCQGRTGVSYDGQQPPNNLGAAPKLTITYDTTPPSTCTDPRATNNGDPLPCTYPPITTGACDNFETNVYCFRTSEDQKVFVLWTKLENENDPSLSTNANALCKQTDPDFLNVPANTSPFKNLGKPDNSDFNYCLKSPQ